jgi:hypothetical protein
MVARHWTALAYACALVVGAAIAYLLAHVPFGVGDTLGDILQTQGDSARDLLATFSAAGFMRPFMWLTMKLVVTFAGGHYFLAFRSVHILMVILLLLSVVRLTRVESALTFALAILTIAAVIGIHPFHEAVHETAMDIKLIVVVVCFGVVLLSTSTPRRWKDIAAVTLIAYAMLANEIGLLAWVCVATAYLAGFRGVSRGAVVASTVVLAGYFYARFVLFHVGTPGLLERSSGFGLSVREPSELVATFGGNPLPFYAYNVLASAMSILLSEPRSGVFVFVRDWLDGTPGFGLIVNVVSSGLSTMVIVWFAIHRRRDWLKGELTYEDRIFLIAAAVVAGNAAISFPYVKDVTMVPAAAFYPLAMFVALRQLIAGVMNQRLRAWRALAMYVLVAAISAGWTIRAGSFYVDMRRTAYKAQSDWVAVYPWLDLQHISVSDPQQRAIVDRLRAQMLSMNVPKIYLEPRWLGESLDPLH